MEIEKDEPKPVSEDPKRPAKARKSAPKLVGVLIEDLVSPYTSDVYEKRVKRVASEFKDLYDITWREDVKLFIEFYKKKMIPFSYATRRSYQASLHYALKRSGFEERMSLADLPPPEDNPNELRGQKLKQISFEDAVKMRLEGFSKGKSVASQIAGSIIFCSLFTGLRPVEWLNAKLIGDRLVVKNAKFSKGRSFAETRTIHIDKSKTPKGLLDNIKWLLDRIKEKNWSGLSEAEERKIVKSLAERVKYINDKCFESDKGKKSLSYTLYTARHQFCANAKAAGLSKVEIAALMGHRSMNTAGEHYARKKHGRANELCVEPDPVCIDLVKHFNRKVRSVPDFLNM